MHRAYLGVRHVALGVWIALVGAGFGLLGRHAEEAGAAAAAPAAWPATAGVRAPPGRPILLFFAHPRCPCTRASLSELRRLLARVTRLPSVHAIFFRPPEEPDAWARTDTWREASAMTSVTVHVDPGGRESARFGVATSGTVLVYDAAGRLVYEGGLTPARGHEGGTRGQGALLDALEAGTAPSPAPPGQPVVARFEVYGCSLESPGTASRPGALRSTTARGLP